jgi:hypothetical protein
LYVDSTTIDLSQLVLDTTYIPTTSVTLTSTAYLSNNIAPGASFSVTGTAVRDTINLSALTGSTTIDGGGESDVITGGAGADSIIGGAGNDTITGGSGADIITGGSGSDTIYFNVATATASQVFASAAAGSDSVYLGVGTATDGSVDHVQWAFDAGTITNASVASAATSMISGLKADGVKHIYGFDTSDVIEFKIGLLTSSGGNINDATGGTLLIEATKGAGFNALDTAAISAPFIEITGTADLNATSAQNVTSVAALLTGTVQSQMKVVFAIDDGTDSYLWYFDGSVGAADATASAAIATTELTLIGVVHNYNDFAAGDFAVIA